MSEAQVYIDETDVTEYAVEGSSTRRLNRPSDAMVRLPMDHAIGGAGSLLKIYFDGVLHHHGKVMVCETQCDEQTGYTVYNSTDPFELWKWRPVRDPGSVLDATSTGDIGDFSNPKIIQDFQTGAQIVKAMIEASENPAGIPDDAEGPLFVAKGSFAMGGQSLVGAPSDWPMTMAQLATLLVSTGTVDIVMTPIELDVDGNYGQVDAYNGNYGTDRTGSVAFQYGMGNFNVRALRWNDDMSNLVNKLWYYLGPRIDSHHWPANITGTSNFFADCGLVSGGVTGRMNTSRTTYGVRMDVQQVDANDDHLVGYCLFQQLWLIEGWLRSVPLSMKYVTPTRDTAIGSFDIGDLVLVEAHTDVRGGFSGAERVYEYTISWDATDSVPALSELQTSAANQGFSTA